VTLCPVALAVTCRKCPIYSVCPLKTVIGDEKAAPPESKGARPSGRSPGTKKS
jgi:hypothetical protein